MDTITVQTFLSIGIVGASLAFAMEWINAKFKLDTLSSKGLSLLSSFIGGTGYYFISQSSYAESVIGVLLAATAFWAFFLNNGKKKKDDPTL